MTAATGAGSDRAGRRGSPPAAAILLAAAVLAVGGCSARPGRTPLPPSAASFGGLPSFLPSVALKPDGVLVGTAGRPALTTEGDSVRVQLAGASVLARVSGPVVPGEGLPYQTPATTCTWTVTLAGASAALPIATRDFTTLDHLGVVYHPTLVAGQPRPPAVLAPGQAVTFQLRVVMPVGEGLLRWAPGGGRIVASWDFEVEND